MNLINKALAAAENDELLSDWRKEPAQYALVIRELVARFGELENILAHLTSPSDDELLYVAKQAGVHAATDAIGTPMGVAITNLGDLRRFVDAFVARQCLHQIQEPKQ